MFTQNLNHQTLFRLEEARKFIQQTREYYNKYLKKLFSMWMIILVINLSCCYLINRCFGTDLSSIKIKDFILIYSIVSLILSTFESILLASIDAQFLKILVQK